MNQDQALGVLLLAIVGLSVAASALPLFMRWGVETRGYRFLCFTRAGAERLAAHARSEGSRAQVVQIV